MADVVADVPLYMKLGTFDNRLDKISLAMMSGVEAKNDSVKRFGIGEDLPMSVFCWTGNKLRVMLQLNQAIQRSCPSDRLDAVTTAVCVTRRGWGIDSFTVVSEAYVSKDPKLTDGIELKAAFAYPEFQVDEALSITHVDARRATFVSRSYKYDVPRLVMWGDEEYHPGSTRVRDMDGMYPRMLSRVINTIDVEEEPFDSTEFFNTLSLGLLDAGFYCQMFD